MPPKNTTSLAFASKFATIAQKRLNFAFLALTLHFTRPNLSDAF